MRAEPMQNVECKCTMIDLELARLASRKLGALRIGQVHQHDTYFKLADGRLKKRESPGEKPTYVHYHRVNRSIPKLSHFQIFTETQAQQRFGVRTLVPWVTVDKKREIWMYRNAHIHFDEVLDLGNFFEAEALVTPTNHVGLAHRLIADIREKLAPALGELISSSYADMAALEMESQKAG
ncbi:MAG: class IV adenylate cyclase [Phycisphaerales bacterium]